MINIKTLILTAFIMPSLLLAQPKVYIKIGEPEFKKPVLAYNIKCGRDVCEDIKDLGEVFASDMNLSNVLILLSKKMYPSDDQTADMNVWKVSGAEYLLLMEVQKRAVDTKLIALRTGEEIFSEKFRNEDTAIDTAHSISNQVYYKLTGQKGIFKTKIAFIGRKERYGSKNLFVMDYDGRRIQQLTYYKTILLTPAWSPDGRYITYTRYAMQKYSGFGKLLNPNLYLYDVRSKREKLLSSFHGQNSSATWTPDGKKIAFTSNKSGDPDIYLYDLDSKEVTPIVQKMGVDVEPSFSPDGKKMVFSSSRTGNPELYNLEMDTLVQKRLTYSRYYNSSPSWSPAGNRIAFAGLDDPFGKRAYFDIFLITPTGDNIERLTIDAGNNENPSWSPDGRHLVYTSTRNGGSDMYFINGDGTGEKRLTHEILCYSPNWSPSDM